MKVLMNRTLLKNNNDVSVMVFRQECEEPESFAEMTVFLGENSCETWLTATDIDDLIELLQKAKRLLNEQIYP